MFRNPRKGSENYGRMDKQVYCIALHTHIASTKKWKNMMNISLHGNRNEKAPTFATKLTKVAYER